MRKLMLLLPCALVISIVCLSWGAERQEPQSPISVLIVEEGLHSREGVAKPLALSVMNPKTIASLESLFPEYRKFPSSSTAGGWEAGYRVYFNFPKGRTVCVTVSRNDAGKTWSTGDGDFATKGDFKKLVENLQAQTPK